MRLPFLLCVTSLAATTALAQQEPSSPSSKATQPSSQSTLSPTGRTTGQQQHFRSTRIIGAPVKTSAAEDVGRIEDVVLNPTSGRIDFAVISAENKLCPVPWQLLSVSSEAGTPGSTSTTTPSPATPSTSPSAGAGAYASAMGQQPAFTLNVEKSKLQQGPSFDRGRWPEMSASWSQKIYTHYGVQADAGVGGTGAGAGSIKSSTSSQSDQRSTGSSSDSSSGKSSSDSKK